MPNGPLPSQFSAIIVYFTTEGYVEEDDSACLSQEGDVSVVEVVLVVDVVVLVVRVMAAVSSKLISTNKYSKRYAKTRTTINASIANPQSKLLGFGATEILCRCGREAGR